MEFESVKTHELEEAYGILRELRTTLSKEDFYSIYDQAKTQDRYEFLAAKEGGKIIGLMGYRVIFDYVHGKHLYIDDLVVTATKRGRGIGARLLKLAEEIAAREKMAGLRLCTGADQEAAKRFYSREGWALRAVAFKKKL